MAYSLSTLPQMPFAGWNLFSWRHVLCAISITLPTQLLSAANKRAQDFCHVFRNEEIYERGKSNSNRAIVFVIYVSYCPLQTNSYWMSILKPITISVMGDFFASPAVWLGWWQCWSAHSVSKMLRHLQTELLWRRTNNCHRLLICIEESV